MQLADELPTSEVARRTGFSGNTVNQWLRAPVRSEMNTGPEGRREDGRSWFFESIALRAGD
jgi:hypothetical protein